MELHNILPADEPLGGVLTWPLLFAASVSALGAFVCGFHLGDLNTPAGVLREELGIPPLLRFRHGEVHLSTFNDALWSLCVSTIAIGALVAPPRGPPLLMAGSAICHRHRCDDHRRALQRARRSRRSWCLLSDSVEDDGDDSFDQAVRSAARSTAAGTSPPPAPLPTMRPSSKMATAAATAARTRHPTPPTHNHAYRCSPSSSPHARLLASLLASPPHCYLYTSASSRHCIFAGRSVQPSPSPPPSA